MPLSVFRYRLYITLTVALGMAWTGCLDEAPHDNPLDPLSDGFRDEGGIAGRVTGIYPPFEGRAEVPVRLVPVGPAGRPELATRTDGEGRFALHEVPAGPYAVVAEGEGFRSTADTVDVTAGQVAETILQLDALPTVAEQELRTVHIVRWFPEAPVFQLEVEVRAEDPDRPEDVAAAALAIPDPAAPESLVTLSLESVSGEVGRFVTTFDDAELPDGVEGLLGKTLRIEVRDASGNAALGPPMSLVRVIEQSPQTVSPQGEASTGPSPTLVWQPAQLPFAFTYRVDLFLVAAGVPNLIEQRTALDPAMTSYSVQQELAPGDYYWTVWVVDAFGNRSRSKEAAFRVL